MKKLLSIILAFSMALSLSSAALTAAADDDYDINFPDSAMNDYMVLNFDKNMDGKVQKSEFVLTEEDIGSRNVFTLPDEVASTVGFGELSIKGNVWITINCDTYESRLNDVSGLFEAAKQNKENKECVFHFELGGMEIAGKDWAKIPPVETSGGSANIELYMPGPIDGDSISLASLEGYRITALTLGGYVEKGYSGQYLEQLDASYSYGPGLTELLQKAPSLNRLEVNLHEAYALNNTSSLHDLRVYGLQGAEANNEFARLMQKDMRNLEYLQIWNTSVMDLTPLKNLNIWQLYVGDYQHYAGEESVLNGKTAGDRIMEQISDIPSLSYIELRGYEVTDLTPIESFSSQGKYFDLYGNRISLEYKNNKAIYDKLNSGTYSQCSIANQFASDCYYGGAIECLATENGSLAVSASVDKKSFADGDVITETLTITNNGATARSCDLYFNTDDQYWGKINIKNGSRRQTVTNLAPGQTVKKTISFSCTDFSDYYLYSGALLVDGEKSFGIGFDVLRKRDTVSVWSTQTTVRDLPVSVNVSCAPDMQKVQIVAEDGTVIKTLAYSGGTWVSEDISIPEKYWPAKGAAPKKVKIKAVVTDDEGRTYSSAYRDITVMNPDIDSTLKILDCNYSTFGSGHIYHEMEPAIMYLGAKVIVRAKLSVDSSEIQSAEAIINSTSYNMTLGTGGKYDGWYGATSNALNSGDYFDIVLRVTTKSGEVLEKFIGYGRLLIDPSGIITDPNGDPIEGVKVTLQRKQEDGTWADWDAENYMQSNPVYTNEKGYYGWDVIEGTYRVIAEKEGYKTKTVERYYSRDEGKETEITVLPPRLDVDFTMEFEDPANPPAIPMTNDTAKTAVQNALAGMTLDASATDADVISGLSSVITDNMYVSFKNGTYAKTASTADKSGRINGTLILENLWTTEQQEISANVILKTTNGEVTEPLPTPTPNTPSVPVSRIKYTVADGKTIFHMPLKGDKVLSHRLDAIVYDTEGGEHKGTTTAQVGTEETIVNVEVDYAIKENDKVKFRDTPLQEN